jgi:pimeloyl-ACP methyl ester carboxylesterase
LAEDVIGVWDALGVKGSVLAGLGLGGVIAAEVAARAPARVSALVPISCRASMTPEYAAIWPPMLERAKGGVAAIAQITLERWFSPAFIEQHPKQIAVMRAAILDTTLEGYVGSIAALLTLDWAQRLGAFAVPVMFVSGEEDRVGAPPAIMQAMCDATPGATHVVLPGATHISPVCNPAAFCDAMEGFVSRL